MFKKRQGGTRSKRTREASGSEEEEDDNGVNIADLRLLQKTRRGKKGVENMPTYKEEVVAEDSSEDEGGILNIEKHFGSTGTSRASQMVDKHLDKFLQEQLVDLQPSAEKPTGEEMDDKAKQKLDERKQEEHEIYTIPQEWSAREYEIAKSEEMNWQAGLVEVPLDVKYRMDSIEQTENAKRRILNQHRGQSNDDGARARERAMSNAFGNRFRNFAMGADNGMRRTGDDKALESFVKTTSTSAKPAVSTAELRKGPY